MGSSIFATIATGLFGLLVAVVTYALTKKREHEADWRKAKLEHYREYVAALSGVVQGRAVTPDAQARYADAVNALTLVASPAVLTALYAFQDEISYRNTQRSIERHDQLVNVLLREMRHDVRPPMRGGDDFEPSIRLMSVPPVGAPAGGHSSASVAEQH
ncbi:hypothetical protein B7R78_0014950 [Ralstonia solanacearum]|uniref:hypothetical protein n=1 Tax=Ralstonia solanacearum TaxID=305 RepID=UPI000BC978D4|nr:hypothetical protein [Ralstonia solanacearum]MBT1538363.1 hypothetical protein [Ralstonia solanacearum]QOK80690.1 hypothetical protein HF906_08060 [Ralstonia solanacearum]